MHIAIIGAGFTGLSAALALSEAGHKITIFEADDFPGGLAVGFQSPGWDWPLEKHYHHLFVSDWAIRNLAAKVNHPITFSRPLTSSYLNNDFFATDSPLSLLKFSPLSFFDRLRTGFGLASLKFNPFWQPLESLSAKNYIISVFGQSSWQTLWEPLLRGKFGSFADDISAAWFWARISKRSSSLGYPEGGFLSLARHISDYLGKSGVKIHYSTPVTSISPLSNGKLAIQSHRPKQVYDKIISTLSVHQTAQLTGLSYPRLPYLGAINLVLSLKHEFLPDHIYWLNICNQKMPFLSIVEHTHFISPQHYGGENLIYIGNYLPTGHPYYKKSASSLLKIFTSSLRRINPEFNPSWVNHSWVWSAPFAQPIVGLNYSSQIPSIVTPLSNFYLANMQQVYPWDRGTNYAVELGQKVAKYI